jgi:hypothetical protein
VSSLRGDTLTVAFIETDFIGVSPEVKAFTTDTGGTINGSAAVKSYFDNSNAEFGMGLELADFSFGSDPFSSTMVGKLSWQLLLLPIRLQFGPQ